jgi:hypothetical protein
MALIRLGTTGNERGRVCEAGGRCRFARLRAPATLAPALLGPEHAKAERLKCRREPVLERVGTVWPNDR